MLAPIFFTLFFASVLALSVPSGFIGHLFAMDEGGDPALAAAEGIPFDHILIAAPLAVLAYAPPDLAATQAGDIAHLRAVPGAAVLWITLAAGVGPAMAWFIISAFGWKSLVRLGALTLISTLVFTVILNPVLSDRLPVPEDSHAFDRHGAPYRSEVSIASFVPDLARLLPKHMSAPNVMSLALLVGLAALTRLPKHLTEQMLLPRLADKPATFALSKNIVRIAAPAALAMVIVPAIWVLYPSPDLTAEQMTDPDALAAIAVRRGEWNAAKAPLSRLSFLSQRLNPGATIRPWNRPDGGAAAIQRVHEALSSLQAAVDIRSENAPELAIALTFALRDVQAGWSTGRPIVPRVVVFNSEDESDPGPTTMP